MIRDQLEAAAVLENIPRFREFVVDVCTRAGAAPDDCFALKLAVDEACTNIVEHGYGSDRDGAIALTVEIGDGEARVVLVDTGRPFSPEEAPRPDLDADWSDRPVGGLGWHLIRNAVDELVYRREGDENRLTLIKRLAGEPDTRSE